MGPTSLLRRADILALSFSPACSLHSETDALCRQAVKLLICLRQVTFGS
jgi:hypothetical protein